MKNCNALTGCHFKLLQIDVNVGSTVGCETAAFLHTSTIPGRRATGGWHQAVVEKPVDQHNSCRYSKYLDFLN